MSDSSILPLSPLSNLNGHDLSATLCAILGATLGARLVPLAASVRALVASYAPL